MGMTFTLTGSIVSGKNQIQLSYRNGRIFKYPNKRFTKWRDEASKQVLPAIMVNPWPLQGRIKMTVRYTPGDAIRRDLTGMLDALFHLLEHVGIVENDFQIKCVEWHDAAMQRNHGKVEVHLQEAP
jgi:Holliday junction resolvase RusA-like endonuclease